MSRLLTSGLLDLGHLFTSGSEWSIDINMYPTLLKEDAYIKMNTFPRRNRGEGDTH